MEQRARRADSNPVLQNIEFRHVAVIDEDGELFKRMEARVSREIEAHSSSSTAIYQIQRDWIAKMLRDEAGPSLLALIREFKPNVLIIHGGTAFRGATEHFIQMLIDIRRACPGLPFVLEGKSEWLRWLNGIRAKQYYNADYRIITRRIGWATSNFVDDAEIDEIIDELF